MKRLFLAFFSIILFFILQSTVFQWLSFGGIVPNIMIILVVIYGIMNGSVFGMLVGFFCGLFSDIFYGDFIGMNALFLLYAGYFAGKFNDVFYPEDVKLPLVLFVLSDLFYGLIYYIIMFLLRGRFDFSYYFLNIIFPELVYTVLMSLLIYPISLFIHNRIEGKTKERGMRFV